MALRLSPFAAKRGVFQVVTKKSGFVNSWLNPDVPRQTVRIAPFFDMLLENVLRFVHC